MLHKNIFIEVDDEEVFHFSSSFLHFPFLYSFKFTVMKGCQELKTFHSFSFIFSDAPQKCLNTAQKKGKNFLFLLLPSFIEMKSFLLLSLRVLLNKDHN